MFPVSESLYSCFSMDEKNNFPVSGLLFPVSRILFPVLVFYQACFPVEITIFRFRKYLFRFQFSIKPVFGLALTPLYILACIMYKYAPMQCRLLTCNHMRLRRPRESCVWFPMKLSLVLLLDLGMLGMPSSVVAEDDQPKDGKKLQVIWY